jgi:hypothetical protein
VNAGSPYFQPVFLIAALVIVGVTCWIAYSVDEHHSDYALVLILLLAMLIFPKTLQHYLVYLLIPLLWLWQQRGKLMIWGVTAVITLEMTMARYQPEWDFWAMALLWLVFVGIGAMLLRQKVTAPRPATV